MENICNVCNQHFEIQPDDTMFYERIGVPVPRSCPFCRARHRLAFRNERSFYKRKCDRCGKESVSMYSPNKPFRVWCHDCWFSDTWDARDFGISHDPSKPFLEQIKALLDTVPKVGLMYERSVNSEYVNISADNKNCYMIIESSNNEDCIHCYWIQECRNLTDVSFASKTELSYESDDCYNSYKLFYGKGCHDTHDGYFLLDCRGCSDCIGCVNLRNKQYHVFNKPFSREAYEAFKKEARLDTWSGREMMRKKFDEFAATQPRRFGEVYNAPNSSGNYIKDSKNCRSCFHCYDSEDCAYGVHVWRNAKDCMDSDTAGRNAELIYNSINAGIDTSRYISCAVCWSCSFMEYSSYCFNANHCLGCVGLRKRDYCILNKQYSKEEYEKKREEIIKEMKRNGEYGDFFPAGMSAFGYNESAAQDQFPLSKEDASALGFRWEDTPRGTYGKETILWDAVPDSIRDVQIDVSKEIFACVTCKKNFRIIPGEFEFYKHLEIPLPRECPDCRHLKRFRARGPNRLFEPRQCGCDYKTYKNSTVHSHHPEGRCSNVFQSNYPPDAKEILYCEQCYQAEVI